MQNKILIIAEAGVNHNGDPALARQLIEAAAGCGADAVKFQCFRADRLATEEAPKADYQTANLRDSTLSQREMLRQLELKPEDFTALKERCDRQGIRFMATPFDFESADLLEPLVDRYKVSSGDCTHLPFLRHIASKRKPVILSTGMTTLEEVRRAVEALRGCPVTLLHCTTNYPCPAEEVNLNAMLALKREFGLAVGYSDHTEGIEVAIAAAALGASVIEKHFTLDRSLPGPDHRASLEPGELKEMVRQIRNIEKALGDGVKRPQASEIETLKIARRSLVFARPLKAGTILAESDILLKRPGTGLPPSALQEVIGRRLEKDVSTDQLLSWEMLKK